MKRVRRTRWSTKPRVAIAVLLVVSSLGLGLYALAASAPAPTITSGPANPSNQTSATFTYTYGSSVTRFECSLDLSAFLACGTTRPSTKSYPGPLSQGPHTFKVRAVSGSQTSAAASYAWTIDTTPPIVQSIDRAGSSPTNATSVSWTATFSENVTGVDFGDFQAITTGLVGAVVTSVSGSGAVYTVVATTGIGSSGTVRLNLVDNDSIRDGAGNRLGGTGIGNGNFAGQTYTIDRVPPPPPHFTQTPPDPSSSSAATFAWTDTEPGVAFRCSKENGTWFSCSSPYTYTVAATSNGQHEFAVQAVDAAGNVSAPATYSWKVSKDVFTITGVVTDLSNNPALLYLGTWRRIRLTLTNPNPYAITVTALSVSPTTGPSGCPGSTNLQFIQSDVSSSHTLNIPAHGTVQVPFADDPQIRLQDLPFNQDACKNGTFGLAFGGTAMH